MLTSYSSPFEQLYKERCTFTEDRYKPNFWHPQKITSEPLCLFGDEDAPVKANWYAHDVILKLLAAGLELELEVGEFVREASDRELPDDPYVKKLLQSNIADEAKHFKGFDYARQSYDVPSEYLVEAAEFRRRWNDLAQKEHPLLIAMAMEIGVFLPYLGCTRLFGGKSLSSMSRKIAEDEYRHVVSNRTAVEALGYDSWNLPRPVRNLIKESIAWAIDDLYIPEIECGEDFDLDFVLRASEELVTTGVAEDFNDTILVCDHVLPFENSNASQYDRVLV